MHCIKLKSKSEMLIIQGILSSGFADFGSFRLAASHFNFKPIIRRRFLLWAVNMWQFFSFFFEPISFWFGQFTHLASYMYAINRTWKHQSNGQSIDKPYWNIYLYHSAEVGPFFCMNWHKRAQMHIAPWLYTGKSQFSMERKPTDTVTSQMPKFCNNRSDKKL